VGEKEKAFSARKILFKIRQGRREEGGWGGTMGHAPHPGNAHAEKIVVGFFG